MFLLQTKLKHPGYQPMAKESLQLAVHFLFHTYLHTKKKLRWFNLHASTCVKFEHLHEEQHYICICVSCRVDTEEWMATVEVLLSKSSEACQWMVQYLVGPEGREIVKLVHSCQLINPQGCCHIIFLMTNMKYWNNFLHCLDSDTILLLLESGNDRVQLCLHQVWM